MEPSKITVYAKDREAGQFGLNCAFDIINSEHKLVGYSNRHFFASARRTKSGAIVRVANA